MVHDSKEDSRLRRKDLVQLLLSHHPPCAKFKSHTINIGSIRLCIGCFIGYPSAVVTLLISFNIFAHSTWTPWWIVILGIIFVFSQVWSFFPFSQRKLFKIVQKLLIGSGSGMILAGVFQLLDQPLWMKLVSLWSTILLIIGPIGLFHYYTMKSVCKHCQLKQDLGYCPEKISFYTQQPTPLDNQSELKKEVSETKKES